MIMPITDSIMYISHVGPVELIETDMKLSGIHILDKPTKTFKNTNITILNGPIMRTNFKIRCSASEYNHFANENSIIEPLIIDSFENISNNFAHLYNDLERYRDISNLNKSELNHIIKQLKNVNEDILSKIHEQINSKNIDLPYFPENFVNKTYNISTKFLPIFIITNTLFMIHVLLKIFKYFAKKTAERLLRCIRKDYNSPSDQHTVINP